MRFAVALIIGFAAVLCLAAPAVAQEPVKSFDLLDTRLKPGDTIWVTDAQGLEIKGKVQSLSPESLRLDSAGGSLELGTDRVASISTRPKDGLRNGVLWGALAGFVGGALSCGANPQCAGDEAGAGMAAGLGIVGAGVGAIVGAVVDGAMKPPKITVYRAPSGAPAQTRVSVAPMVGPRAKGLALSFTF